MRPNLSKGTHDERATGRAVARSIEGREDSRAPLSAPARSGPKANGRTPAVRGEENVTARKGRPPELDESVVVTVRLPRGLVEALDEVVRGNGYLYRDRSELIRQTLAGMTQSPVVQQAPGKMLVVEPGGKVSERELKALKRLKERGERRRRPMKAKG